MVSRACTDCGYSNYSDRTQNLNPILSCIISYSIHTNSSDDDNDLPNNRFFTSTPAKKTNVNKTQFFSTKIIILSYNGVKGPSKLSAFYAALDVHKPDIVHGCVIKIM